MKYTISFLLIAGIIFLFAWLGILGMPYLEGGKYHKGSNDIIFYYARIAIKIGDEFKSPSGANCNPSCREEISKSYNGFVASSTEGIASLTPYVCDRNEWGVFCESVETYCKTDECRRQVEAAAREFWITFR